MKTENERVAVNLMIDRLPKSVARNSHKTAMYVGNQTYFCQFRERGKNDGLPEIMLAPLCDA